MRITGFRKSLAIMLLVLASCPALAQSDSRDVQLLVAKILPASPERFSGLCDGGAAAGIWCGGCLTGLMHSSDTREFHPCHPSVDAGSFIYEGVWNVTWDWLFRQPPDSEITLKEAIIDALNELEGCDL